MLASGPSTICGLGSDPQRIYDNQTNETICHFAEKDGQMMLHFSKPVKLADCNEAISLIRKSKDAHGHQTVLQRPLRQPGPTVAP